MFLLRSIFWLTIVFTSMAWTPDGMRAGPGAFGRVVADSGPELAAAARQAALGQITARLTSGTDDPARQLLANAALTYLDGQVPSASPAGRSKNWCIQTEEACARDAAKLTALIAAGEPGQASDSAILPAPPRRMLKSTGR